MSAKKKLSFEACLRRLEEVVEQLEDGQITLEESLKLFGEGVELLNCCQEELTAAEKTVQMLVPGSDGKTNRKQFTVTEETNSGF